MGVHAALAVDDRDRHRDRIGKRLGDLAQAAAAQDDPGEPIVDLRRALETDRLGMEDHAEDGTDDLVERGRRGQLDQGEAEPVSLADHRLGDRADVARRFDRHPGQAVVDQVRHELGERLRVLAERIGRRQEELVRLHPVEDVRDLHDVHRANDAIDAGATRDEACSGQDRQGQDVGDRHAGDGSPLAAWLRRRFEDRGHRSRPCRSWMQ